MRCAVYEKVGERAACVGRDCGNVVYFPAEIRHVIVFFNGIIERGTYHGTCVVPHLRDATDRQIFVHKPIALAPLNGASSSGLDT